MTTSKAGGFSRRNKLDKNYLKSFNLGYEISKETGLKAKTLDKLKPEQLEKLSIDKNHLSVIKLGMKQYEKDLEQNLIKKVNKEKKISSTMLQQKEVLGDSIIKSIFD